VNATVAPLRCRVCGDEDGPFTSDGLCEACADAGVEPGVYDISAEMYHADPVPGRSLSSTQARQLATKSPATYRWNLDHPQPYKAAFDLGTAAHKLVLDDGPELVLVDAERWDTKAVKAEVAAIRAEGGLPLKRAAFDQVHDMAAALRADEEAAELLEPGSGDAERSLFWEAGGIWRRARFDWLRYDGRGVDYKSTRSAHPDDLPTSVHRYGYHQQQEWYVAAGLALGVIDPDAEFPFSFVFQETEPPYLVTVTALDATARQIGAHLNQVALNAYAWCRDNDTWPGYLPAPLTSLPAWVERQYA
jgi:hypothetical protein